MDSTCSTVTGHGQHVTFALRWSSDLSEPHQPGGRHLQRGGRGHAEQPGGGAAHYLTAKRCPVCCVQCGCISSTVKGHLYSTPTLMVLWTRFLRCSAVPFSPNCVRSPVLRNHGSQTAVMTDGRSGDDSLGESVSATTTPKISNRLHVPQDVRVLSAQVEPFTSTSHLSLV